MFIHGHKSFYENMNKMCDIKQKRLNGSTIPSKLYMLKSEVVLRMQDKTFIDNHDPRVRDI